MHNVKIITFFKLDNFFQDNFAEIIKKSRQPPKWQLPPFTNFHIKNPDYFLKKPEEISQLCTLTIAPRANHRFNKAKDFAEKTYGANIVVLKDEPLNISSTERFSSPYVVSKHDSNE